MAMPTQMSSVCSNRLDKLRAEKSSMFGLAIGAEPDALAVGLVAQRAGAWVSIVSGQGVVEKTWQ